MDSESRSLADVYRSIYPINVEHMDNTIIQRMELTLFVDIWLHKVVRYIIQDSPCNK